MREFMTKVSDFISERRNDPEKGGDRMVFCMLGIVVLAILILCLLLWRRHETEGKQERREEPVVQTKEETIVTALAGPDEEDGKRQQLLTSVEHMGEDVEALLAFMRETKETLEEIALWQEGSEAVQRQAEKIGREVAELTVWLQNTQSYLYDLFDIVQVMDSETIPAVQVQIAELGEQMAQIGEDISDIYQKIGSLEITDRDLQAKISAVEDALRSALEQNREDAGGRFADVETRLLQMENLLLQMETRIGEMSVKQLQYRYDAQSNTLYLFPDEA